RPSIAIAKPGGAEGALDLDGFFGLHPRMSSLVPYFKDGNMAIGAGWGARALEGLFGLHPRMSSLVPYFKDGNMAIVHACGSPDDTRSHFDAQDYMESGTPGLKSTRDGWMNRYLHAKDHEERSSPFRHFAPRAPRPR